MRIALIFFVLLIFTAFQKAGALPSVKADTIKKVALAKKDSSAVNLRKFEENPIRQYRKQKEFIYDDVVPPGLSWWDRFWIWFWRTLSKLFGGGTSGSIIKYLVIALVVAIVVFLIIKFSGVDFRLLMGKSKAVTIPYQESLENIHEIDFEAQIEKAIHEGNYRLVVRLLYLKTLKQLNDKNLIDWQPDKTNQTYVQELQNEQYQHAFATLTNQFEYIWYGEFHIDSRTFEPIQVSFQQFNQQAI
jgi:hypothetical protein